MEQQLSVKIWFLEATAVGALPTLLVFLLSVLVVTFIFLADKAKPLKSSFERLTESDGYLSVLATLFFKRAKRK